MHCISFDSIEWHRWDHIKEKRDKCDRKVSKWFRLNFGCNFERPNVIVRAFTLNSTWNSKENRNKTQQQQRRNGECDFIYGHGLFKGFIQVQRCFLCVPFTWSKPYYHRVCVCVFVSVSVSNRVVCFCSVFALSPSFVHVAWHTATIDRIECVWVNERDIYLL